MDNPQVSNPNDFKVVTLVNNTDFEFTPDLGAMYDGRPIFGKSGKPIQPGESVVLPYHIGNLLAKNLAKAFLNKNVPADKSNIPTGVAVWDEDGLNKIKSSFITEMYSEEREKPMSETEKLMAKVEEYKKLVDEALPKGKEKEEEKEDKTEEKEKTSDPKPQTFADKADVIKELEKRKISFNPRMTKANLEKLLA